MSPMKPPQPVTQSLPVEMSGHWDTDEGHEMATEYLGRSREELCHGELSDFALANRQYMASRDDLDLLAWQTAAKERIRWLSAQLAAELTSPDTESPRLPDAATLLAAYDEHLLVWMRAVAPTAAHISGSDFSQGVIRGFEIIIAQIEHGHHRKYIDFAALSPSPARDGGEVERAARRAFEADCLIMDELVNWGSSTEEQPRGFKTEIMRWEAVARAILTPPQSPSEGEKAL